MLLTANGTIVFDREGIDRPDVTDIKRCAKYFRDASRTPAHRLDNIIRFHSQIAEAITGNARPKVRVFRDWQVEKNLGGTGRYTEYRAKHNRLGESGGMVRLRVHQVDPLLG